MDRLQDVPARTTLTLDDDVAANLQREARRSGRSFRSVVNDAIRAGLRARERRELEPFEVQPFNLGLRPGYSLDSISELIDRLEGPEHR